jgi:hypothetical protein
MASDAERYFPNDGTSAVSGMTEAADFERALTLLAAAADPSGCTTRLAELRKQITAATKAKAELDAARAAHDRAAAALEAREAAVAERERVVTDWEAEANARGERERFPFDPNGGRGTRSYSGLARA